MEHEFDLSDIEVIQTEKLRKQMLESAGIYECEECNGKGLVTGKVVRNFTTRAEYEEDIERPCINCVGTGINSRVHQALTKLAASINGSDYSAAIDFDNYREIIGWRA